VPVHCSQSALPPTIGADSCGNDNGSACNGVAAPVNVGSRPTPDPIVSEAVVGVWNMTPDIAPAIGHHSCRGVVTHTRYHPCGPEAVSGTLQSTNTYMSKGSTQPQMVLGSVSPLTSRPASGGTTSPIPPLQDCSSESREAAISGRLRELCEQPDRVVACLGDLFAGADPDNTGQLPRDIAAKVLAAALAAELRGVPSLANIGEAKWRGPLKRFGVYAEDDCINLQCLAELYTQNLETLRDCFAPRSALRDARKVPRSATRLKDRYDGLEFLAKDSLGKVYRCRERASKEPRVCRQLRKDKASVPIDRIRRSLARLEDLDHPNVPKTYECLEDFHNLYLVSAPESAGIELMDHLQDMYTHSNGRGLSECWIAGIVRQLLDAAAYCHSHPLGPVLHRDLCPSSIRLASTTASENGTSPRVLVANFGLRVLFDLHHFSTVLSPGGLPPPITSESMPASSAPECLAPEVWRQDFGPRSDVWACGCLLFLLLTGHLPFAPELSIGELLTAVSTAHPDWRLLRDASTGALSVCRRMLTKDDALRPSAAECLRHPWFLSPANGDPVPRELRGDTFTTLVEFHARSKYIQVLMNIVATELKVGRLRHIGSAFARLDSRGVGILDPACLEAALTDLEVSSGTVQQVVKALDSRSDRMAPYGFFMAGCADLVEDKLDHMLWKVFALVDEDHSGEVGVVELEHLFDAACGRAGGSIRPRTATDVERYLRNVLGPGLEAAQGVELISSGSDSATFEDFKRFVIEFAEPDVRVGFENVSKGDSGMEKTQTPVLVAAGDAAPSAPRIVSPPNPGRARRQSSGVHPVPVSGCASGRPRSSTSTRSVGRGGAPRRAAGELGTSGLKPTKGGAGGGDRGETAVRRQQSQ